MEQLQKRRSSLLPENKIWNDSDVPGAPSKAATNQGNADGAT
jgi:hypothetical protein